MVGADGGLDDGRLRQGKSEHGRERSREVGGLSGIQAAVGRLMEDGSGWVAKCLNMQAVLRLPAAKTDGRRRRRAQARRTRLGTVRAPQTATRGRNGRAPDRAIGPRIDRQSGGRRRISGRPGTSARLRDGARCHRGPAARILRLTSKATIKSPRIAAAPSGGRPACRARASRRSGLHAAAHPAKHSKPVEGRSDATRPDEPALARRCALRR
jgi:hypothetical protein